VPAFTIGVSGLLVASTFGYDVPEVVRAIVSAVGAIFALAMTVALERNRLLQLHRRKDLIAIENRLHCSRPRSLSTKRARERFQEAGSTSTGSSSSSASCAT
jgi:hypothetical protein